MNPKPKLQRNTYPRDKSRKYEKFLLCYCSYTQLQTRSNIYITTDGSTHQLQHASPPRDHVIDSKNHHTKNNDYILRKIKMI
jgi:hypothetical protein